jgi:hypothetical protein
MNGECRHVFLGMVALGPAARRACIGRHDQPNAADAGIGAQRRQGNGGLRVPGEIGSALATGPGGIGGLRLA